jgi:hypothetical protein
MFSPRLLRHLLVCLASLLALPLFGARDVVFSPVPEWTLPPPEAPAVPLRESPTGIVVVLDDEQVQVETGTQFSRQILRLTSPDGLAQIGEWQSTFEPAYQTLTLHHVRIHRGETTMDRLDRSRLQVLHREQGAEDGLFDGRLTALLVIDDLRVGDTVDIASSITGRNPVFEDRYCGAFTLQGFSPGERRRVRLVADPTRLLRLGMRGSTETPPAPRHDGALSEWLWEASLTPSLDYDYDAPSWHVQAPFLEVSESASWAEVAQWGQRLFSVDTPLSDDLAEFVAELRHLPREQSVLAALHRIQEDIRYLSLSLGESSHRPHPPVDVFQRRLGDCKDKSLLLTVVLRELGFDAAPALVASASGPMLAQRLPSPIAFDHAIVHLIYDGRSYWLDPTRSHQAGSLEDHSAGDITHALPLRDGQSALVEVEMPRRSRARIRISESYSSSRFGDAVILEVRRKYSGSSADSMRSYLRDRSADLVGRDEVNRYARSFPAVELTGPVSWTDNRETNEIELRGSYRIPDFWALDENRTFHAGSFVPFTLYDIIGQPDRIQRHTPLAWGHPLEVINHITATLPGEWDLKAISHTEQFASFDLDTDFKPTGSRFDLSYHYRSTRDHVPVGGVAEFARQISSLRDRLGYELSHPTEGAGSDADEAFALNLPMVVILLFVWIGGAFAAWKVATRPSPHAVPPPLPTSGHLVGLGGWLILPCISLFVGLVVSATALATLMPVMLNLHPWQHVTTPGNPEYHPLYSPVLLFEATFQSLRFEATVLALILFFRRHRAFPRFMIVLIASIVIYVIIDGLVAGQLPGGEPGEAFETTTEIGRAVFAACIWIPYFLISKRVRLTFTQ